MEETLSSQPPSLWLCEHLATRLWVRLTVVTWISSIHNTSSLDGNFWHMHYKLGTVLPKNVIEAILDHLSPKLMRETFINYPWLLNNNFFSIGLWQTYLVIKSDLNSYKDIHHLFFFSFVKPNLCEHLYVSWWKLYCWIMNSHPIGGGMTHIWYPCHIMFSKPQIIQNAETLCLWGSGRRNCGCVPCRFHLLVLLGRSRNMICRYI